ncbi:GtrA family protein [Pedobacter antarcticus]|uniref:GtrA family protein n=1 Tax=Pedobacter antarcticus TaxID=34086 RepID=UPI0029315346|nr:GtrA family protein [Pedobacter antarcticus]
MPYLWNVTGDLFLSYRNYYQTVLQNNLIRFIDFFYPPFSRIVPITTFRYGVTGGGNAGLNLVIFFLSYNYILRGQEVTFGTLHITSYIAAYLIALSVTFPVGFLLNKYVVFQQTDGRGKQQLILYAVLTITTIILHYALLHLLVGYLGFWATPSEAFIIVLMAILSYFFQSYVTFRKR